jgi:hypothetical protein
MQEQRCLAFPDLIEGYGTMGLVDGGDPYIRALITHYKSPKIPLVDDTAVNNSVSRMQGSGARDVTEEEPVVGAADSSNLLSKETLPPQNQEQIIQRIETRKEEAAAGDGGLQVRNFETGKRQQLDSGDDSDSEEGYGASKKKKAKVTAKKGNSFRFVAK